jgi:heme exporter protein A
VISLRSSVRGTGDEPVLQLSRVAHRFGPRWVLRGCSLTVEAGEAVALLGGNGAGKTTLLKVAATLLRPSRGSGRVLGCDLLTDPDGARGSIGMMGFSPGLYEDLTADENLRFACRMRGEIPDDLKIHAVLEEVGLGEHARLRVRGFSSGMRRRVALARVLLHTPRLLLLDEPYAALDDEGADRINDVIRRIVAAGGAVVAATHDLPRARGVVDRVVRIEGGLLHEIAPADAFRDAGAPLMAVASATTPRGSR